MKVTLLLLLLFVFFLSTVLGIRVTVGPSSSGGNFTTIKLAYQYLESVNDSNDNSNTIELLEGTYTGLNNVNLILGERSFNLVGQGEGITILDCGSNTNNQIRFFSVIPIFGYPQLITITIANITVRNCNMKSGDPNANKGGSVYISRNDTVINIEHVTFDSCISTYGGAFYMLGNSQNESRTQVNIRNTKFLNNQADSGGAIQMDGGVLSIDDSVFYMNSINNNGIGGGAITLLRNKAYITSSLFHSNNGPIGSSIYLQREARANVNLCDFANNNARSEGTIKVYDRSSIYLSYSTFNNNSAGSGGSVYVQNGGLFVTNSNFTFNEGRAYGGVVYGSSNSNSRFEGCLFSNNNANDGGVFYLTTDTGASITRSSIINNQANNGGAFYLIYRATITLTATLVSSNTASNSGGALWCGDSYINLNGTETSISQNQSPQDSNIHCSTIVAGTFCKVKGGDFQDFCKPKEFPSEGLSEGVVILIAILVTFGFIIFAGAIAFAVYYRYRKARMERGKMWDFVKDDETKRNSKRDSKKTSTQREETTTIPEEEPKKQEADDDVKSVEVETTSED